MSELAVIYVIAIIVLPLIFLSCVGLLIYARMKHTHPSKKLMGVTILSGVGTLPAALLLTLVAATGTHQNAAKVELSALTNKLSSLGDQEICDNGDSGYGLDNASPWYTAYFEATTTPGLVQSLTGTMPGYAFKTDDARVASINQNLLGREPYDPSSVYLLGTQGGKKVQLSVVQKVGVPLYCSGVPDYGKLRVPAAGHVIVQANLNLPAVAR